VTTVGQVLENVRSGQSMRLDEVSLMSLAPSVGGPIAGDIGRVLGSEVEVLAGLEASRLDYDGQVTRSELCWLLMTRESVVRVTATLDYSGARPALRTRTTMFSVARLKRLIVDTVYEAPYGVATLVSACGRMEFDEDVVAFEGGSENDGAARVLRFVEGLRASAPSGPIG
jgi:hypothetical protein